MHALAEAQTTLIKQAQNQAYILVNFPLTCKDDVKAALCHSVGDDRAVCLILMCYMITSNGGNEANHSPDRLIM